MDYYSSMRNPSYEPVNFYEGNLLSSSLCVFDSWVGGYYGIHGGEGGSFSPNDRNRFRSQNLGFCNSPGVELADMLPPDPFKINILPLDPFEMYDGETTPDFMATSSDGDCFRFNDEFEEGDALFPGFNWLYRGTIRYVPDTDFEELDEFKKSNQRLMAADDLKGILEEFLESDSDMGTFGWGETACESEGITSFEEHVVNGSALCNLVDMLPSDPFGMETARLVCRGRVRFISDNGDMDVDGNPNEFAFDGVLRASDFGEFLNLGHEFDSDLASSSSCMHEGHRSDENSSEREMGEPNYAILLALNYMGVKELLSVEKVCKSLNDAVKNNPSLWKNIRVDFPLNRVLTDYALMQLTSRASGHLESLTLVGCCKISDMCIRNVFHNNPRLTKLSIPGCLNLSIEGILSTFISAEVLSIKQLRVGCLPGITNEQLEELQILLSADPQSGKSRPKKPLYYHDHRQQSYLLSADDDRAIDVEKCPKCSKVRLVYDCPAESCQKETSSHQACKACILCIGRCIGCGSCLIERDYLENFGLDAICLQCCNKDIWLPLEGHGRMLICSQSAGNV